MTSSTTNALQTKKMEVGTDRVPVPPDGGWGWMITFSSFMVSVLVDGVCFSFGILFTKIEHYFGESKMKISWAGSVLNGSYMIVGPIVGSLVTKYGCRRVAGAGAVIASASFFISAFSPNIEVFIITYGLMGGIGLGFMYLPAMVMVGYYFEKRRALATGIACCGSGIGAFVFAPLSDFLLEEYNWQGTMWIMSGLVLNGLIFSCAYRPVTSTNMSDMAISKEENSTSTDASIGDTDEFYLVNDKCFPVIVSNDNLLNTKSKHSWKLTNSPIYRCHSADIPTSKSKAIKTEDNKDHCNMELTMLYRSQQIFTNRRSDVVLNDLCGPMRRKDIFYSGNLANHKVYRGVSSSRDYVNTVYENHSNGDMSYKDNSRHNNCKGPCTFISTHLNFSLLLSPTFSVYGASCFLCMTGFFVPFIYIPPLTQELNMSLQQAAYLISIIGIVNTVGRVAAGYISDHPWVDCLLINNVALITAGVVTFFVPYYSNFGILAAYCCVFGLAIAVFVSLRSIIMVELLGLEKLTNAFGLVIMCQGLSSLIGAPIAGALSDVTGNFDASFYMAGSVLALAGIICLPLRRISTWEHDRAQLRSESEFKLQNSEIEMVPMVKNGEII